MTPRLRGAFSRRSPARRAGAAVLTGGIVLIAVAGCASDASAAGHGQGAGAERDRGSVVSARQVAHLSLGQTRAYLRAGGYGSPAARTGVKIFRIVYRTISSQGKPDIASGVLALPVAASRILPVVEFGHGTMVAKADAPSVSAQDRREVTLFAGAGYASVEPDYLGLGLGTGVQPYLDPAAETSAAVDMLRAAYAVAAREHRRLAARVLVTGFSEGGQAAMALGSALQHGAIRHVRLAAVAPVSGPYDLLHAELPAVLNPSGPLNPKLAAFYLAYWVITNYRLHRLHTSLRQMFLAPFDTSVPRLDDGLHSDDQVLAALPASPRKLFTARFLRRLAHPAGSILRIIRADDTTCTSWIPKVPVRLYAARSDTQVTYQNSIDCEHDLAEHGHAVPLIDLGKIDHFPSERVGLTRALSWFEHLDPSATPST